MSTAGAAQAAGGQVTGGTGGQAGGEGGTAAGAAATAGATTAADWTSSLDELSRGYVQNKGWKGPGDVLQSYQNLEKLHGVPPEQILKLPTKDDDVEGWDKVHTRLGRPSKADEYEIPMPAEGGDEGFAKWAKDTFHGANLTKAQAKAVASKFNEYAAQMQKTALDAQGMKNEQEEVALKREWGAAYQQNIASAQSAAKAFGFDAETVSQLEKTMGYAKTMKFVHALAAKIGEANHHSGQSAGSAFRVMTPEAAKAEIAALRQDNDFTAKYLSGDLASRQKMDHLHQMAYAVES